MMIGFSNPLLEEFLLKIIWKFDEIRMEFEKKERRMDLFN